MHEYTFTFTDVLLFVGATLVICLGLFSIAWYEHTSHLLDHEETKWQLTAREYELRNALDEADAVILENRHLHEMLQRMTRSRTSEPTDLSHLSSQADRDAEWDAISKVIGLQ